MVDLGTQRQQAVAGPAADWAEQKASLLTGMAPTGEITLVPLAEEHAEAVVAWRNDPRLARWFFGGGELTLDGQRRWTRAQRQRDDDLTYVVHRATTPVGMAALYHIDHGARQAEFGRILIVPAAQRQGLAAAAAALLFALGFERLRLDRLYCNCLADNEPILRFFGRFGFAATARGASGRAGRDAIRLELTRERWASGPRLGGAGPEDQPPSGRSRRSVEPSQP